MRKLVLAGVLVVVVEGSVLQLAAGLVVCFISTMAYSAYQPYDKQSDDNLQLFAQLQLFLTLLGGMMLKVNRSILSSSSVAEEEGSESQAEIMGIVLILCNVSVLVWVHLLRFTM